MSKQIIVGNTCKESDVILEINNCRRLEVGEVLEFDNLGAYLLNEIPEFLLDYPSVYHKD
ncbi:diaminopimelate decarboxylase [Desulfitispora alkaliphila]